MSTTAQELTQKPITSPLLTYIQHQYRLLHQMLQVNRWNIQDSYKYRMLKTMLNNETRRIRNDNWDKLMEETISKYKEPREFWKAIKT